MNLWCTYMVPFLMSFSRKEGHIHTLQPTTSLHKVLWEMQARKFYLHWQRSWVVTAVTVETNWTHHTQSTRICHPTLTNARTKLSAAYLLLHEMVWQLLLCYMLRLLLALRIRLLGLLLLVHGSVLKSACTWLWLLLILRWLAWTRPRPRSCGRRLATCCWFNSTTPWPWCHQFIREIILQVKHVHVGKLV